MVMNNQTVEVFIDELVLHGFSPRDRYQISADVEMELSRLFNEKGLPSSFYSGGHISILQGDTFNLSKQNKEVSTGSQIAGSVYSSFQGVNNKPV